MKHILFICTGNTCRSAMAQGIFNRLCSERNLPLQADSCGICADGSPACKNAIDALSQLYNIDISSHISKQINEVAVNAADLIFAMSRRHADAVIALFPKSADKIKVADPEISDPFMCDIEVYKNCAREIHSQLAGLLKGEDFR